MDQVHVKASTFMWRAFAVFFALQHVSFLCNNLGQMQCMYAKNKIINRMTLSKVLLGGQKKVSIFIEMVR